MERFKVITTEDFFADVQKAREALKRMRESNLHTTSNVVDYMYSDYCRLTGGSYSPREFNKIKRKIKILSPDGRWCAVPVEVQAHLNDIIETEKEYAPYYCDTKSCHGACLGWL